LGEEYAEQAMTLIASIVLALLILRLSERLERIEGQLTSLEWRIERIQKRLLG